MTDHRPTSRFDRRHLTLLLVALACVGGLVLWVGEIDLGLDQLLTPQPAPSPASPPAPAPTQRP
jgi:hypothetical protein